MEEAITPPILAKKKIYTVNKIEKSQACNKTVDSPKSNKTDTVKSLDKSRSTQITDTETQWINQGPFQDQIVIIKVPE